MAETVHVRKVNKILEVRKDELQKRLDNGWDQIDDNGKTIKKATGGSSVSAVEHSRVYDELQNAKAEIQLLKEEAEQSGDAAELAEENKKLKQENSTLKGKLTKLEKEAKEAK